MYFLQGLTPFQLGHTENFNSPCSTWLKDMKQMCASTWLLQKEAFHALNDMLHG